MKRPKVFLGDFCVCIALEVEFEFRNVIHINLLYFYRVEMKITSFVLRIQIQLKFAMQNAPFSLKHLEQNSFYNQDSEIAIVSNS